MEVHRGSFVVAFSHGLVFIRRNYLLGHLSHGTLAAQQALPSNNLYALRHEAPNLIVSIFFKRC